MLELCQECCGYIGSSCCCQLTNAIQKSLDLFGIDDFWIQDIKYDYDDPSIITQDVVLSYKDVRSILGPRFSTDETLCPKQMNESSILSEDADEKKES